MIALRWEWVAIGYYAYLLVLALAIKRFARARTAAFAGTIAGIVVIGAQAFLQLGSTTGRLTFSLLIPLIILLVGYWLSGLFFVSPMRAVERWLMAMDDRLLRRSGILAAHDAGPRIVRELFEPTYVLVYPVIPAAAVTLAIGGHPTRCLASGPRCCSQSSSATACCPGCRHVRRARSRAQPV